MAYVNESLFDKRIVERNIAKGLVKREDYEKYLGDLNSLDEQYEYVAIPTETVAEEQAAASQDPEQIENEPASRVALEPQSPVGVVSEVQQTTGRMTPMHDLSGSIMDKPIEFAEETSAPQPPMQSVNPLEGNAAPTDRETTEIPPFVPDSSDSTEPTEPSDQ